MPVRISPKGRPVRLVGKGTVVRRLTGKGGATTLRIRPTQAGRSLLFRDTFTDANGVGLASHQADIGEGGGSWGELTGTPTINSNHMVVASSGGNARALGVSATDKFTVTMRFNFGADGISRANSIRFRYKDNANFLMATARRSTTPVCQITVWKRDVGVMTSLAQVTLASDFFVQNTEYELKVVVNGQNIKVYIDNVEKLDTTQSFLAGDAAANGFCAAYDETLQPSGQYIDSFAVYGPTPAIRLGKTDSGTF